MLSYNELREAVDKGYIQGNTVQIVRKNGKVFDYVLPEEEIKLHEVVSVEVVEEVLEELRR